MEVKYIILEGVDSSGKSSFKHRFNSKTDSKWIVIDRLFGSAIAYGIYKGRSVNFDKYYEQDTKLAEDGGIVVYLYTEPEETLRRLKECGDDDITLNDVMPLRDAYDQYLQSTKMPVIKVDTTNLTKDEVVDTVIEKLKELNYINYYES